MRASKRAATQDCRLPAVTLLPLGAALFPRREDNERIREEARMFLFFSNQVGLFGSIAVSILLSLILLYACSM
jgi:hypothetical protein